MTGFKQCIAPSKVWNRMRGKVVKVTGARLKSRQGLCFSSAMVSIKKNPLDWIRDHHVLLPRGTHSSAHKHTRYETAAHRYTTETGASMRQRESSPAGSDSCRPTSHRPPVPNGDRKKVAKNSLWPSSQKPGWWRTNKKVDDRVMSHHARAGSSPYIQKGRRAGVASPRCYY